MPLYEYRCTQCGHHSEVLQKINDRPLRKCAECSGKLEKLISRTSFQLKGGGWFSHGYGNSSGSDGKGPSAGTSGSASADSSGESKSGESKSGESAAGDSKKSPAEKSDSSGGTKSSAASA